MTPKPASGLYRPGTSLLHRVDPRIKVLSTFILVMLVFAASSWIHLVVIGAVIIMILTTIYPISVSLWRVVWMLRWLLLFTFLLHMLFTPGRTLWGTSWLSYDGLLIGVFVCIQLLLAVALASIMALTTSIDDMVAAFGWVVSPLSRFGVNTAGWEKMTLLSLNFIPIVYEQAQLSSSETMGDDISREKVSGRRWSSWARKLNSFVLKLVEQGDGIAHDLIAADEQPLPSVSLAPLVPLTLLDKLFLLSLITAVCGYWLAGKII